MSHKTYAIDINDNDIIWEKNKISFEEVVHIAFPQASEKDYVLYTVTYFNWQKWSGSLTSKKDVNVQDWMSFTCTTSSLS